MNPLFRAERKQDRSSWIPGTLEPSYLLWETRLLAAEGKKNTFLPGLSSISWSLSQQSNMHLTSSHLLVPEDDCHEGLQAPCGALIQFSKKTGKSRFSFPFFFLSFFLFSAMPLCGMRDLSSPTRDQTRAPCSGSAES